MGSDTVVIHPPCLKNLPGMAQRGEQGLIEAFVPQPAIEAFNESVLLGLSRRDILPFHTAGLNHSRTAEEVSSVPLSDTQLTGGLR